MRRVVKQRWQLRATLTGIGAAALILALLMNAPVTAQAPVPYLAPSKPAAVVASGNWYVYTLLSDGTALSWGLNTGVLGDGTAIRRTIPGPVKACRSASGAYLGIAVPAPRPPDLTDACAALGGTFSDLAGIRDIRAGQNLNLAILDNGTPAELSDDAVVAWGVGTRGEIGDGLNLSRQSPVKVLCGELTGTEFCSAEGHLQGVVAIAVGGGGGGQFGHGLALLANGSLAAWGYNNNGQLGIGVAGTTIGTAADRNTPVLVECGAATAANCRDAKLASVAAVAGSNGASYALLSDGTLLSWGFNNSGRLGDGSTVDRSRPGYVVCGEMADSDPFCSEGRLAGVRSIPNDQTSPHFLVRLSDNSVVAWGAGNNGQLGDGSLTQRLGPVRVRGEGGAGFLTDVVDVAMGNVYSMALQLDGTVVAWGADGSGQLGDGTQVRAPAPVRVGVSNAVRVGAGFDNTYAIVEGGDLYSWGNNNNSQLARPPSDPALSTTPLLTLVPLDASEEVPPLATVLIDSPADGAIVRGTISIAAKAWVPRSNAVVSCVPAVGDFDTTSVPNGLLSITCGVEDGRRITTRSITVNVVNDADDDGVPDHLDYCPGTVGAQLVLGCSAAQILACKPGNNAGEAKDGLARGTIDIFTTIAGTTPIGWAQDCRALYPESDLR